MLQKFGLFAVAKKSQCIKVLLIIFWSFGILVGFINASRLSIRFNISMQAIVHNRLSIVGGILVLFLPLLLTAILRLFFKPIFLIPLAFVKAYIHAFIAGFICLIFGNSGQWYRFLITFSASVSNIVCLALWLSCIDKPPSSFRILLTRAGVTSAVILCVDFCVISTAISTHFHY